jgi:hypothetical protein
VRTSAELDKAIAKTLTYAGSNGYARKAVFAADQNDIFSFGNQSDAAILSLGAGWDVSRAYISSDPASVPPAKATLIDSINSGAGLVSYVGHSGPTIWTFAGLLNSGDVAALTNAGKPTVVFQWGCWTNYYAHPTIVSMGNAFMTSGDNGAAAVLGATTLTLADSEEKLAPLVMSRVAQPGMTIGAAVTAAKQELAQTSPDLLDVQIGWTILGDPTTVVTR